MDLGSENFVTMEQFLIVSAVVFTIGVCGIF